MALQHLRSSTANKRPLPAGMSDGQLAINTNLASPGLFFKDSNGDLVKVGPVHVGTTAPNASPASGGQTGNTLGEQWLDTTGGTYVFKVWDGSAWRSESGTFVDVNGDVMTGALGIIAGTAGSPGLYISGDTNTGIYSPGADQVSVATGGTERLRIDSNGQIEAVSLGTDAAPVFSFTGDPNTGIYSPGADQLALSTGGTGRLFIDSSGNIGIGSAPSAVTFGGLDIRSGGLGLVVGADSGASTRTDATTKLGRYLSPHYLNAEEPVAALIASNDSTESIVSVGGGTGLANAATTVRFFTAANNTTTSGTERLRITSAGLVGIGTSSPSTVLHISSASPTVRISDTSGTASNLAGQILFQEMGTTSAMGRIGYTGGDAILRVKTDGAQPIAFLTNDAERVRITSGGNVGIGTTAPSVALEIGSATGAAQVDTNVLRVNRGVTGQFATLSASGGAAVINGANGSGGAILFQNDGTERARIESGRLLVGTSSSASAGDTQYARLQVHGNTFGGGGTDAIFGLRANLTAGTNVSSGNTLGRILFSDTTGATFGQIECAADGTVSSASDLPGRLVFSTCGDGASSPTERVRIDKDGLFLIGKTVDSLGTAGTQFFSNGASYQTRSGGVIQLLNRTSNDGDLVLFYQDGTQEGSISVSGTTVSYNGAHLSRWSQLPSGAERTEILRGSVLSNIDEMCEWGEEDNEQLNRMKVSDVEGDKNVSGVFQAWDDDDDTYTNDFYCAMTGDFIIRIAQGVTVERGDLLMSAGDGTAKPQDDDIIRSKTIAKVTSTNVSRTYDDGSYCVPCVLMAC